MFLDFLIPLFFEKTGIVIINIWVMRIVYFTCMAAGSIVIETILEKMHVILKKVYLS